MFKKLILVIASMIALIFSNGLSAQAQINVTADAAAVIEKSSGQVVYEKKGNEKRPPASLTKMMTAVIAVEYGDLNQIVRVSSKAAWTPPSKLYLRTGEEIKLNDLLKAALMISANDACVAISEHVGGDEDYFVYLMNLKAWALNLSNTHFSNTNGLPAKNHYSSAIDLARLGLYCKKNVVISQYVAQKQDIIYRGNKKQMLNNTNKMLWSFPGANGIKTGTTNAAGNCLASSAKINDNEFVAVVLHADNRYRDSSELLNYAFNNFYPIKILSTKDKVPVNKYLYGYVNSDIYYPLKKHELVYTHISPKVSGNKINNNKKCAVLVLVTQNDVLWYDIYAKESQQNSSQKLHIIENIKELLRMKMFFK